MSWQQNERGRKIQIVAVSGCMQQPSRTVVLAEHMYRASYTGLI